MSGPKAVDNAARAALWAFCAGVWLGNAMCQFFYGRPPLGALFLIPTAFGVYIAFDKFRTAAAAIRTDGDH